MWFIEASSALCSPPFLLAKKHGDGVRFCVDYRKSNDLTKKDAYPIPIIEETLAQLKHARYFTKIGIRQVFHKLRLAVNSDLAFRVGLEPTSGKFYPVGVLILLISNRSYYYYSSYTKKKRKKKMEIGGRSTPYLPM